MHNPAPFLMLILIGWLILRAGFSALQTVQYVMKWARLRFGPMPWDKPMSPDL